MQSQSLTGGFHKPRDVVGLSYYERLMAEKKMSDEVKKDWREKRKPKDTNENDELSNE